MIKIILNNDRIFNKEILEVLEENPDLLGIDENICNYLKSKIDTREEEKIVNNMVGAPKENYDILNDTSYVGNIILLYNPIIEFWEIEILVFQKYRKNGYAKDALRDLINLYPDRKFEANILCKNNNIKTLQKYFIELGFEKTDNGLVNSKNDIVYNFRKSKKKTISIIASAYLQPISDLLFNLLKRSNGNVNEVQTSELENGYSAAICILLVACFESYVMSDIYFNKNDEVKNPIGYIKKYRKDFPYLTEIIECYVVRDLLLHNHIWEIEHTSYDFKFINKRISSISGDKKFAKHVNLPKMITNKLELNINPIRINRQDVKKVLKVIWESLNHFSNDENSEIYLNYNVVFFDGVAISFREVYERIMVNLEPHDV
ncbi:MAG: hypothetical protein WC055_16455 [Melioribacteraceae bacterium]